jgi:hypothetical protein
MSDELNLLTPGQYRVHRSAIFPTAQSVEWFVRKHRATLVEQGAISYPTGRMLIVPELFDRVVIGIGNERAKKVAAGNRRA